MFIYEVEQPWIVMDWEKKARESLDQILKMIPEQLQNVTLKDIASQAEKQAAKMGRAVVDMTSVLTALVASTPEHLRSLLKVTLMASGQWLENLESMLSGQPKEEPPGSDDGEIPIDGEDDKIDIDFD